MIDSSSPENDETLRRLAELQRVLSAPEAAPVETGDREKREVVLRGQPVSHERHSHDWRRDIELESSRLQTEVKALQNAVVVGGVVVGGLACYQHIVGSPKKAVLVPAGGGRGPSAPASPGGQALLATWRTAASVVANAAAAGVVLTMTKSARAGRREADRLRLTASGDVHTDTDVHTDPDTDTDTDPDTDTHADTGGDAQRRARRTRMMISGLLAGAALAGI